MPSNSKKMVESLSVQTIIILVAAGLLSTSCASTRSTKDNQPAAPVTKQLLAQESHSSNNSLDWQGVYRGVIPCADCEGIDTRIILKRDGSFHRSLQYLGKDEKVFSDEGKFSWDNSGNKITLKGDLGQQQYQVGENQLFHLDRDGNRITGNLAEKYRLAKSMVDPKLEDKKWVLKELMGKPYVKAEGRTAGYIQFSMETGSYAGNNTCNNFFGQYELMAGDRIRITPGGSTLMACPDMDTQNLFMEVLQMADNYTVADNVLSLNKARMAPLARFTIE